MQWMSNRNNVWRRYTIRYVRIYFTTQISNKSHPLIVHYCHIVTEMKVKSDEKCKKIQKSAKINTRPDKQYTRNHVSCVTILQYNIPPHICFNDWRWVTHWPTVVYLCSMHVNLDHARPYSSRRRPFSTLHLHQLSATSTVSPSNRM